MFLRSVDQKSQNPSTIAVSAGAGVLISGYLARAGAISAGHDPTAPFPFPDLTGFVIFTFGALACPILSVCLLKLLARILPKSPYRAIFTFLVIPALIAFPTGVAAYRLHVGNLAADSTKAAAFARIQRAKSDALQAQLISDPEIALRDRWFEVTPGKETQGYLFSESLKSARVPYSLSQLARIYQEAPAARALVVAHPDCDPAFLTSHWSHALSDAEAGNFDILIAIVSNPKTPIELLENLESSPLLSHRETPGILKQTLDARLYHEGLVMSQDQQIQAQSQIGLIKLYAETDLHRTCVWNDAARSTTLEARKGSSPDGPILYFYGSGENSGQANVTTRIEFQEGKKSFQTPDQAILWIRQQSERIPTIYRNDGLLVSSNMNAEKNQITIEVWQILINANKPALLAGGDDGKITVVSPISTN